MDRSKFEKTFRSHLTDFKFVIHFESHMQEKELPKISVKVLFIMMDPNPVPQIECGSGTLAKSITLTKRFVSRV